MNRTGKGRSPAAVFLRVLIAAGTLVSAALALRGYSGWLARAETFRVRNVEVSGNEILSSQEILSLAGVERGMNIWETDLMSGRGRILENPFIEEAVISRQPPAGISIRIREKSPVALLNAGGRLYAVDRSGLVLPSKPGRLYGLPVLSGYGKAAVKTGHSVDDAGVSECLRFLELVLAEAPGLYPGIGEIVMHKKDGFLLYTGRGGVPVRIGRERLRYKIRCLDAALKDLNEKKEFSNVSYIDLRFDGLVVVGKRT